MINQANSYDADEVFWRPGNHRGSLTLVKGTLLKAYANII